MAWFVVKTLLTILILVLVPGWAIISISNYWRKWEPLQRWFLAACLGVAFWPVLYYATRAVLPSFRIGDSKLILLLVTCTGLIIWTQRKNWREHFVTEKWGWLVLAVLFLTLLSRLYVAFQNPYLAGDDALHHVLLTDITASTGVLPYTLDPYGSTSLDHYHLGFYALTAPLKLLAGISSDQAVLWMSQFLNGICGVGIFLVLDKKVSRPAAIIGMLTAGLLSPYPSWFINWSRFTQLTAQTILLPACLVLWDTLEFANEESTFPKRILLSPMIESVSLISAVCLTHFRVAGFLLPLIIIICLYELIIRPKPKPERLITLGKTLLIGILVFLLILPALLPGLTAYINMRIPDVAVEASERRMEDVSYYSKGEPDTIRIFFESGWLLILMVVGTLSAFMQAKTRILGVVNLLWIAFLILTAYMYKLNIYVLVFTNITAVVLAFYLPISIGTGLFFESLCSLASAKKSISIQNLGMFLALVAAVVFVPIRINDFEPQRAFMTPEDQKAMEWIRTDIPEDAVFGVNINFLNPTTPFGTDAGYWLPYYANRETTTLTLISGLDEKDQGFINRALGSRIIYEDTIDFQKLCDSGITHLYSGAKQPYGSPDFSDNLSVFSEANLIYDLDGVEIYQICER